MLTFATASVRTSATPSPPAVHAVIGTGASPAGCPAFVRPERQCRTDHVYTRSPPSPVAGVSLVHRVGRIGRVRVGHSAMYAARAVTCVLVVKLEVRGEHTDRVELARAWPGIMAGDDGPPRTD